MIDSVLARIGKEYESATCLYNDFNSFHEGYAVILEELDEVWDEVKKKKPSEEKIEKECIQVAAMAVRMILDLCK